ncbi:hypothetical protein AVEN_192248-1 [Araneus ventricosus]|uniref:Uncharacterized protein n=1 Tax=Araneus ventricosus TaxID=182803 RepID=A0A4Y2P5A8_ARAVE|nr:hypothetical protein AVEN_192248-1 [Araneus ventricosus]
MSFVEDATFEQAGMVTFGPSDAYLMATPSTAVLPPSTTSLDASERRTPGSVVREDCIWRRGPASSAEVSGVGQFCMDYSARKDEKCGSRGWMKIRFLARQPDSDAKCNFDAESNKRMSIYFARRKPQEGFKQMMKQPAN